MQHYIFFKNNLDYINVKEFAFKGLENYSFFIYITLNKNECCMLENNVVGFKNLNIQYFFGFMIVLFCVLMYFKCHFISDVLAIESIYLIFRL